MPNTPTPPAPAGLHEESTRLLLQWKRAAYTDPWVDRFAAHCAALDLALKRCEEELEHWHESFQTTKLVEAEVAVDKLRVNRDRLQREVEELRLATKEADFYRTKAARYLQLYANLCDRTFEDAATQGVDPCKEDCAVITKAIAGPQPALSTGRKDKT
jgi:chromosome segregation ATPase